MENELIRVIIVEPEKAPYEKFIPKTLEAKQKIVGGYIEVSCFFKDPIVVISNEDYIAEGLPYNRLIKYDDGKPAALIQGNFIVAGEDLEEGEIIGLTDELFDKYMKMFEQPEFEWHVFGHTITNPRVHIYQTDFQDYLFRPWSLLVTKGIKLDPSKYSLVYEEGVKIPFDLEGIYARFNIDIPEDYTGRSLSISDVIVITAGIERKAFYVDLCGFVDVTELFI